MTTTVPSVESGADLPDRSRGVIALHEASCTSCMLCARECPDWCIYIDSHKETIPASPEGGRAHVVNVLDRFAIDYALCMYCGICIEVCPYDALFWTPEFDYAGDDVLGLTHERGRLSEWLPTAPGRPRRAARRRRSSRRTVVGVIRTRLYRDGKCIDENFDPARISDHLESKACVVWLDLESPTKDDLALIADEFSLNPLAVEDATAERQRPKLDHYEDHIFISMYDVTLDDSGELHANELAVFASKHYLITVRKTKGYSIDPIVARWDENANLGTHGVGYLLWGLLDVLVDGHFDTVQQLDDRIEALEELLFEPNETGTAVQRQSFELRKSLVAIRRIVLPTREVVNALMRRENGLVDAEMIPYYQDVYDHVLRAADWTDSLRDLVSTILETNLTIQSNRMNEIMKKVTSWAAIAAVPAVITGYYGMNVRIFPGAGSDAGGWSAILLMLAAISGLYVMFRKQGWL